MKGNNKDGLLLSSKPFHLSNLARLSIIGW